MKVGMLIFLIVQIIGIVQVQYQLSILKQKSDVLLRKQISNGVHYQAIVEIVDSISWKNIWVRRF